MNDIHDFIIEAAGFSFAIESHRLEEDRLVFITVLTKSGEEHRLEVTVRECRRSDHM